MSRLAACFERLSARGHAALVPFITAGDPFPDLTAKLMHALVAGGADIIELGVPFSDPQADGPVIQRSSERALAAGMNLGRVLDAAAAFRADDPHTPVVLMGYLNPFEAMGYAHFAERARASGVDGVLTVDLPAEEAEEFGSQLVQYGLDHIFLIAPTTSATRLERIARLGSGYLYYVSFKGVTGADRLESSAVAERLRDVRSVVALPVVAGFGIREPAAALELARASDGVVIGSALVEALHEAAEAGREAVLRRAQDFLAPFRAALDTGQPTGQRAP
jgi:tryptophan synthase alpha chain